MVKSLAERIADAKARKERADAKLTALQAKAKVIDRKRDTRRKIVVGGAILAAMEKDALFDSHIRTLLRAYVGRDQDKETISDLFAFPASSAGKTEQ